MKKPFIISLIVMAILGTAQLASPVSAVEPRSNDQPTASEQNTENKTTTDSKTTDKSTAEPREIEPTFAESINDSEDNAFLRFGRNVLSAGNNVIERTTVKGLLFSFGNQLNLETQSEYGFVAGNIVEFAGQTKADLFIAGNSVKITDSAQIGRDTFAAANIITVDADLPGDFSAGAARVTFNDVKINGNVNLDVAEVHFTGTVEIAGKLILNDDAVVSGLANAKYAELEKYENIEFEATATEILVAKIFSILGLFVTMVIILALFARTDARVERELTPAQFGKDLVVGFCALVFIPIIAIFLIISFFAAPAGLVVLAAYLVMLYLAQGFASLYIGKLIIKKLLRLKGNRFLEVLLGIVILSCAGMVPGFGWAIVFAAEVLGLGLILQSINPARKDNPKILTQNSQPAETVAEAEVVKSSDKSKTSSAKATSPKSSDTAKSDDKSSSKSADSSTKVSEKED